MEINQEWNFSGIYRISVKSNKKEYFYIGSSKNIYQRLHGHKSHLIKGDHGNPIMQNLFNKYSIDRFKCEIIEKCSEDSLAINEQKYIDLTNPYINITREVIRNTPSKETSKKISETLKRKHREGIIPHCGTERVPIDVYNIDGVFIETLDSISSAYPKYTSERGARKIGQVCRKKRNSVNGYYFRFSGEEFILLSRMENTAKGKYYNIIFTNETTGGVIPIQNGTHGLYKYLSSNLYKNTNYTYTIKLAPVKPCEFMEKPEEVNHEPSIIEM